MSLRELCSRLFKVRAVSALDHGAPAIVDRSPAVILVRRVVCAGLLGLFVYSSAPSLKHALAGPFPNQIDAFHSSNAYLQAVTGSANASQRIIDVMASLPADKPLLIFERERDAGSAMLGMALAYLAWPREVRFEIVTTGRCDEQLAKIAPNSVSAVAFCDLPSPSWVPGGMRLGQNGRLIAFAAPR